MPWAVLGVAVAVIVGLIFYLIASGKREARERGALEERAGSLAEGKRKQAKAAREKARRTRRRGSAALDRL